MKIRKGFVTNSSSTNFGTMLVTSLGSVGIASILNILNTDINAKKKAYVRLVVEAPARRVVAPGDPIALRGEVVKVEIVKGVVSGAPVVVGQAEIDCVTGESLLDENDGSYSVTTDMKRIQAYRDTISFNVHATYEGEKMSALVDFTVADFSIEPDNGVFVVRHKTEQTVKLRSGTPTSFSNNIDSAILQSETVSGDELNLELKLIENVEAPEKLFTKSNAILNKQFKMTASVGAVVMEKVYTAKLLNECILVPKQLREPIVIKCYTDQNQADRQEKAFILPIKVVKYDEKKKTLITDIALTNDLAFEFHVKSRQKKISNEKARKALEDAKVIAELHPENGAATLQQSYAKYRIYADALAEAETDSIEISIVITSNGENIEPLTLSGDLKPKIDLKGLITQFIEYPSGSFIGSMIKLGDVDIYMGALDFVSEVKLTKQGNPKYHPGHNIIYLSRIPDGIQEFKAVQTIHHELAHVIEEQHGDKSDTDEWDERHSYFIQYLSDAAKALSDFERGQTSDASTAVADAITGFALAFTNFANAVHPPNRGEIISWFGARTLTAHEVFDKYLDMDMYASDFNIPENIREALSKEVARTYFPGNIMGRWKESGGAFDGMDWRIGWSDGRLNNITPISTAYTFKELSRRWVGGRNVKLEIKYFVIRSSDKDEDEITAVIDGGTFDPSDYHFPRPDSLKIKWKPDRGFSESILGSFIDQECTLIRA